MMKLMKHRNKILLGLALLVGMAAFSAIQRGAHSGKERVACCPVPMAPDVSGITFTANQAAVAGSSGEVVAYYFHGTVRCDACLLIELLAKNAIEQHFRAELDAQSLVFRSVNYDLPENESYRAAYGLPPPALVLVRQQAQSTESRVLGETWSLLEEPPKFDNYVATQVREFLKDKRANANPDVEPTSHSSTH
jgi:hypothetical protein